MLKNSTNFLLIGVLWLSAGSCDDEITVPPKPSFTVDRASGLAGDTEFTFKVTQVDADNIALLPYGLPGGDGGIVVKGFENGVATVKFKYDKPGTFKAIVISNNHADDGGYKNTQSDPLEIVITSDDRSITEFKFDKVSTKTEIDTVAKTIKVTVPYGTDVTKLKATYTASGYTTVRVGSAVQASGTTENNFTSPVVYVVSANNGATRSYTVTVIVTPVEKNNDIETASAKATSKTLNDKALLVDVNNTDRRLVVYDTLLSPSTNFDSVRITYKLSGTLSNLKYGGKKLKQDSLFNLVAAPIEEFIVYPEDSLPSGIGPATYRVYATDAPKLLIEFPGLVPSPVGATKPVNFNYDVKVLSGTNMSAMDTRVNIVTTGSKIVTSIKVVGGPTLTPNVTAAVNYSLPAKIELTVNDTNLGFTYKAVYTVTVTAIQ